MNSPEFVAKGARTPAYDAWVNAYNQCAAAALVRFDADAKLQKAVSKHDLLRRKCERLEREFLQGGAR